jgi:hypothetical protein
MAYDSSITKAKGIEGGVDGAIAGGIAAVIIGVIKANVHNLPTEAENPIAVGVGISVSAIVVGIKRLIQNWSKHRKDK